MPDPDRRNTVPFDPRHFEKRAAAGDTSSVRERFEAIHNGRLWNADGPVSGAGAAPEQTVRIVEVLPAVLRRLGVRSMLDLPCGDVEWIRRVDLGGIDYIGADIVPALIENARRRFGGPGRRFVHLDVLADPLPAADLVLCRDLLVHFSFADIRTALGAVRASGARWLLTTTFPNTEHNDDITTGDWRPIDLTAPPFSLPAPAERIVEGCTEGDGRFADKSLGLWPADILPETDSQPGERSV